MNQLNEIINKAHENAVKHGVYECDKCDGRGDYSCKESCIPGYVGGCKNCKDSITNKNCADCNGTGKTVEINVIAKLLEEVSELERSLAKNKGDKLADIILVCLAASKELNIPIIDHLQAKNKYNEVHNDN